MMSADRPILSVFSVFSDFSVLSLSARSICSRSRAPISLTSVVQRSVESRSARNSEPG